MSFDAWSRFHFFQGQKKRLPSRPRVHAAGIDALLGGLKRNGFSFAPVHHALRIFQSARKAVDAHQVALAWKRALPVALKLREVEKAGKVIISRRFAI